MGQYLATPGHHRGRQLARPARRTVTPLLVGPQEIGRSVVNHNEYEQYTDKQGGQFKHRTSIAAPALPARKACLYLFGL